jgi:general stress protein 26
MTDSKDEFWKVLKHFGTAMVVTHADDGSLRSRPMAIADSEPDGDLWFATSIESGKVSEIWTDNRIAAALQSEDRFMSISGRGELIRDRAKIDELWKESWRVWFPNGKDDPELVLLRLRAEEAEYWDQHGSKGLNFAFEAGKALLRGERHERTSHQQHAKVTLKDG